MAKNVKAAVTGLAMILASQVCVVQAADIDKNKQASLAFSDPASVLPAPAGSVGQADRSPTLDVLPGFQNPPRGFGIVPFYWWLGDPLTKERLAWELDQLDGMGICGLQINYAHSDKGGRSYGLTYPSDPPLFSDDWWKLVGWFIQEGGKRGFAVSLSDYTLGFGQGWTVDEILRENPDLNGMQLRMAKGAVEGALVTTDVKGADGKTQKVSVCADRIAYSYDPMNPKSGPIYARKFFGQFEDHFPGEGGKGLNFFFSDELGFGLHGHLWTARFAEEFKKRKGYDIVPELPALFMDIGPRTPKIRLDFNDVQVALTEEGFFKPVFDWHQQRGMTMGCDHGGRGGNVVEFGDYFRTQRWNQGPGADQPRLGKSLVKAKVASSIAHLYQRPRVWLEGYYSSGWGTTSAGIVDATFADFVMGYNLLSFHGLYYATHGGWWEWAPPCNGYHMPYWRQMKGFTDCVQRLSYMFTQGDHRCDVAILYPVAPVEAEMGGKEAVSAAFGAAQKIYAKNIDFDFMDFESLDRAKIVGKELHVSGEAYRVLVLPGMKAIRHSTLVKALEFHRAGGVVLAVGALPEASDRIGRDDPEVAAMVKELFPYGAVTDAAEKIASRDFEPMGGGVSSGYVMHRKLGPRDMYALYGFARGTVCRFRAEGKAELWDPWTGQARSLPVVSQKDGATELALPLTETEIQLLVFSPGQAEIAKPQPAPAETTVAMDGEWDFKLIPTLDNRYGDYHWPPTPTLIGAEVRQMEYTEGDPNSGPWKKVTCSFGPQFYKLGPLASDADEAALAKMTQPDKRWQAYEFSWRWGREGDPGHQGYHGLKANITDEFICLGAPGRGRNETLYGPEKGGTKYYLWTNVTALKDMTAYVQTGTLKPSKIWVNGEAVPGGELKLKAGANPLLVRFDKPGRTYVVVSSTPGKGAVQDAADASAGKASKTGDAFSPAAYWIWYPGEKLLSDRWFRKSFDLDGVPAKATVRITCDNGYKISINGQAVGEGTRWEAVQEYDVTRALKAGRNEIVVAAHNGGSDAGLIVELSAGATRVATDRTWRVSKTETGPQVDAEQVSPFVGSLWYKHKDGPPRLDGRRAEAPVSAAAETPASGVVQPRFVLSPLAMTWWNNESVLSFDTRASEKSPAGWYRFTSPPALQAFVVPAKGKVRAWVGGREVEQKDGRFVVAQPSPACVPVLLQIEQQRGCYGGAAITDPIRMECGQGTLALGDWAKTDGLLCYSGCAVYGKTVTIPAAGKVVLNLGEVACTAEVKVNGQPAGVLVSPPWQLDITGLVKPGENRIEVLVRNTMANHYTTIPTPYRGSTVSGLLGPVTLRVSVAK